MATRGSYVWAGLITAAIAAWMATGEVQIGGRADGSPALAAETTGAEAPFRVRVRRIEAEPLETSLTARGRTQADQRVEVKAQISGLIEAVAVKKGERVATGDLLCQIEKGAREAAVLKAQAALAQAELDFTAASTLSEKGYAAQTRLKAAEAARDGARAGVAEAQLEMSRTEIRAPSPGVIEDVPVEVGSLLSPGQTCALVLAPDPMLVVAQVPEREVARLSTGMQADVRTITGEARPGRLRYIAPTADPATRTFRVEIEVDNRDGALRDGVTSEIVLPTGAIQAHRVPPAALTLDDNGQIGVRSVAAGNVVHFAPVKILSSKRDAMWVAGLPAAIDVIVVGQDYVVEGQTVEPVLETAEAGS